MRDYACMLVYLRKTSQTDQQFGWAMLALYLGSNIDVSV